MTLPSESMFFSISFRSCDYLSYALVVCNKPIHINTNSPCCFYFLSYFYFSNKCELGETKIKFSFHDFYTFILDFFFHLDERLHYKIKYSHQKQILQQLCGTYIPCWALIICVCSISDMHVWLVYLHCTSFYYCKME